jgi:phosphatidylinositol-3-phosphatase
MQLRLMGFALAGVIGLVGIGFYAMVTRSKYVPPDAPPPLDRVMIIILENYHSERVDPRENGLGQLNPFLNGLAAENRLELNYFGVSHPSLPNYIAMIGGDFFGVRDNGESCFNPEHQEHCNRVDAINLVDQLEEADIAWEGLFESMPSAGFLGGKFPNDLKLYAQKHNPFVYFKNIASDPARLAKLKPFDLSELKAELADPVSASRFIYIVPNQCHDQHGIGGCEPKAVALAAGDAFLTQIVPTIVDSPAFTERSVLFIAWDDSKGNGACCGGRSGGGRIPLIAVTKHAMRVRGTTPSNHYSLLATIEDGFGLPRIANARDAATVFDLLPDFLVGERERPPVE